MASIEEIVRRIVREEVRSALEEWQPAAQPPQGGIDLLGTDKAAAFLDVAPATLRDWRVDRKGPPAVKFGSLVKYRREDLERWIAERAQRSRA